MILGVFGIPSSLTHYGANLMRSLMERTFGECELLVTGTIEEVKNSFLNRKLASAIFFNEYPAPPLIALLAEEKVPLMVFLDNFNSTVHALIEEKHLAPVEAARIASISFSALEETVMISQVLIIRNDVDKSNLPNIIREAARALRLSVDVQLIVPAGPLTETPTAEITYFEPKTLQLLQSLSPGYDAILERKLITEVTWPAGILLDADKRTLLADQPIELVGPARFLVYGPYFGLPRGKWIAEPLFDVYENASGNAVVIDLVADGKPIVAGKFSLPKEGAFACDLPFEVLQPNQTLEIRFLLEEGAIEGRFVLREVHFRRQYS